jgi:hypothetical protein
MEAPDRDFAKAPIWLIEIARRVFQITRQYDVNASIRSRDGAHTAPRKPRISTASSRFLPLPGPIPMGFAPVGASGNSR